MKKEQNKKPFLALILSLIPGLSHLYLGKIKKAVVLFIIDAGLVLSLIYSNSYLMKLIAINIYLFTFLPACLETYNMAKGKESWINTDSKLYTVILLLTTGFSALPLLWQNKELSKRFKIIWTIAVPLLALVFVGVLASYWDNFEQLLVKVFE